MYYLGDEIMYKNRVGIVIDIKNEIIFDNNNFYKVDFLQSNFIDALFEDDDDLKMYLELVSEINEDIIDLR